MSTTHLHSCTLCEATCGITVTVEDERVTGVRGDPEDPRSRGYLCPKATALADIHADPDRLRTPLIRSGDGWREAGWTEALDHAAAGLRAVRREDRDALAVYHGNPGAHNLGAVLYGLPFYHALRTRNLYSASSMDQLPHMLAAWRMFGHQGLLPVPDVDRTELFVCIGANPLVSNGSILTAPNMRDRLAALRRRGGRLVVLDPRRTETAAKADEHLFIRPGTDALLLASLVRVLFEENLVRASKPLSQVDVLRAAVREFGPERTAPVTGIPAATVRALARELAASPRAVVYGRIGVSTQEFGGACSWLITAVNALTGHLDEPGGAMFALPAVDLVPSAALIGQTGSTGTFRSRVRGLPEVAGELPVVALAEEIATPGPGRVRGLLTVAGNPALSSPDGSRLEAALPGLDFMVSVDPYLNETTRHANVILPPTVALERAHYELVMEHVAVRAVAKYSPAVFRRGPEQRHDWEILAGLATRVFAGRLAGRLPVPPPEVLVDLLLRRRRLSLRKLRAHPHGIDLGGLAPRFPHRLYTADGTVHLAPQAFLADLPRLRERLEREAADLLLIGRRQLRDNNSWMHNSRRLVKGRPRCTLLVHPSDARRFGLADGQRARLRSRTGAVLVPVEVTESVMPGVVSLPHGWGHHRAGTRMRIAEEHAGVSLNDITDTTFYDELTGTAALSGLPVSLEPAG
ncbi:molybdopterin-dependent oxidoreductase [Sciscionella sediminilitoris]|uniref:molybdopterin-dependent oxidoreductase n=1 Tax=Sciscionella sediminilitoris TaxID=1445613 RepID=UPI0004DF293C|nr:molybdopterin-dependent oxidoreductase [Sciscionella sp. SE31]